MFALFSKKNGNTDLNDSEINNLAQVFVDLSKLNIFSIERTEELYSGVMRTVTVIGYIDNNGVIDEWTLRCNIHVHNDLVNRYKKLSEKTSPISKII